MQDYELTMQHVMWRMERLHARSEIVTKRDQGVHRMTNGDLIPRVNQLAGALKRLGIKPGDRVATLSFNNYRHLELYYAVPCMGAVLHTLGVLQKDNLAISEQDVVLPIVPMFHANSWGLPYAIGMAGSKVLFPDKFMGDAKSVCELADQEGATVLAGVPTIWIGTVAYLKETGKRLPKVHTVVCGGSAVPRSLMESMEALGLRILHAWGMTETSPLGSVARPRAGTKPEDELNARLTQGVIVPAVEIRICDAATGQELPWDGVAFGEIQVRGPWIARGYYNGYDPGKLTEDGWFRTGDVAKISPDGYIQIVDRTKDVIKSGGEWISSVELDNAVMAHPKIIEAAVIGLPHPKWDERPVVYAVARPEFKGQVTEEEIREFLRDKVAKWWLPDEVRFIDEVPKTSVGKFDKKVLRANAAPIKEGVKEEARK